MCPPVRARARAHMCLYAIVMWQILLLAPNLTPNTQTLWKHLIGLYNCILCSHTER